MPTWLTIIIIVAVIGAIIGYLTSDRDEDKGKNAASGALMGAIGCGYVLFEIFITVLGICVLIWIFRLVFC